MSTNYETYDVSMLVAQKFNGAVYTGKVEIKSNKQEAQWKWSTTEVLSQV